MQSAREANRDQKSALRFCQEILPEVSRTFAISVRFLPGRLGRAVLCSYLLMRIADTLEDDPIASASQKVSLLARFMACFEAAEAADKFPGETGGVNGESAHVQLVQHADLVFQVYRTLPEPTRRIIQRWVDEMVVGMKKFVTLYPHGIRIQTLEEYNDYCYYVAGTVGHLLTDLWHEHSGSIDHDRYRTLLADCEAFGEALQTVNILKDIAWDAEHENSIYIPEHSLREHGSSQQTLLSDSHLEKNRAALAELVELAWADLDAALTYLLAIPRQAVPIRLFCILPMLFAYATLREITRSTAMLTSGGTVKISRAEVKSLIVAGSATVLSNRGIQQLVDQVRSQPYLLRWVHFDSSRPVQA
ncbi:phytoene/squalene synthase family protein [Gloeobacter kilaueensis]|uniref:Squalene/phytoene synthase n=1 Tax=Gloeobacter kilaueensis (strain ATCC BAA-2537 / CCAP 1431/1 / ULC 316 / JS1) TaxID=1183438 RepID=U5QIE1_GLOK1|nr:phytoene/squalene synthase family protein [Gloeobacter kilaueensis]AGY58658.1 squalene/phytoene synthase [Gloeobacter kilaueensis JS1]